jgi:hypothetical protein
MNLGKTDSRLNKVIWELPLKTVSEGNISEHWKVSSKRHRQQQYFIRLLWGAEGSKIMLPCVCTMIRLSSRFLDEEDNLRMAFKWIKDEIGACLFPDKVHSYRQKSGATATNKGHCDSSPLIIWKYGQEKSNVLGIRIEFL